MRKVLKPAILAARGSKRSALLIVALAGTMLLVVPAAWALTVEEEAKLLPADGAHGDRFGYSVAIDGDTAVISGWGNDDNGEDSGSAYVFTRTAGLWIEQAKLLPADGYYEDYFGEAVALDGNTAVIGAPGDNDNGIARARPTFSPAPQGFGPSRSSSCPPTE